MADRRIHAVPWRVAGASPRLQDTTMPWCETCSRFLNPNSLNADGSCPTCGRVVAEPAPPGASAETVKAPWHFKLLLAAVVIYLVWRVIQMISWVVT
jgi:hypothetical protein